jgi:3-hydroxyacyl-[acyl-carrier-protein] dehydratase
MNPDVTSLLPHRHPFLFVDRLLAREPGRFARALKNVSLGEPYFLGHFPGYPVMPGVLIVEAMAQTAALAAGPLVGRIGVLAGVDGARFRRPVVPGDQLVLEAEITSLRRSVGKAACRATVDGELVAEAEILFALRDVPMKEGVPTGGEGSAHP